MKIIQGFVTIPQLADNAVGVVADFGEFSKDSQTYSADIRHLSDTATYPNIEVITVKAIDESSNNININTAVTNFILHVSNWIYEQSIANNIPLPRSKTVFQNSIAAQFDFCKNVVIGEILPTNQPSRRLIDYVRFDCASDNESYRITLWFNDARFRAQYNYYDIVVIPPVDDLSRLIENLPTAALAIQSTSLDSVIAKVSSQTRKNPPTNITSYKVIYHDPTNNKSTSLLETTWVLVLYGSMSEDSESIKAAIRDYLSDHSNYDKWHVIFPDLYSTNEFVIIPFWDAIATKDYSYDNGLYRTLICNADINKTSDRVIPKSYKLGTHSEEYIKTNIEIGSAFYRTMSFMAIGSPTNSNAVYRLTDLFPDYMAVSTDSPDFSRMTSYTQSFALKFNEALNKARLYNANDIFPAGFTRAIKGSRTYIGFDVLGYSFFILTKEGYLKDV